MPVKVTSADSAALAPIPTPAARPPRPGVGATPFAAELVAAGERRVQEDVQRLYQWVEEEGHELKQHPDEGHLARYRRAVRDYLQAVLPQAYRLKTHVSHQELSVLVEEVNGELAALTQALMAGQQEALSIAARIDRINGILLDLRT